nr:hypothetical protein [Tanacetum cinerariifolium]
APVTPPRATMTVSSTCEVGGPSTVVIEGPSFPLPAPGLPVADSIAIGGIHPRVATVREQVQVMESQAVQVVNKLKEIETRVQQVESRVDTHPSGQMAVQGQEVIVGSSEQVQTLQTALHETELQNQQLWTRVTEMESHNQQLWTRVTEMESYVGVLMSHMLGWRSVLQFWRRGSQDRLRGPSSHFLSFLTLLV